MNEPPVVFREPWEAQSFAMTLALFERGYFTWPEWSERLAEEIARAQRTGDPDTGETYYRHWQAALERIVADKGLTDANMLARYRDAWDRAADRTPHGRPIELQRSDFHMTDPFHVVHHDGYDPKINSLFVPAIVVDAGKMVFVSGVTAAPVYHDHPHQPEVFDAMPLDIEGQARLAFEHLAQALHASGCEPRHVVMLTRYFTDIAADQDTVNRLQGAFFGGHLPTSTTVEVKRMATDPRVRLEIQAIAVAPIGE